MWSLCLALQLLAECCERLRHLQGLPALTKLPETSDLFAMFAPHTLSVDVLALCEYNQVFCMDYSVTSKEDPDADLHIYRILSPPF